MRETVHGKSPSKDACSAALDAIVLTISGHGAEFPALWVRVEETGVSSKRPETCLERADGPQQRQKTAPPPPAASKVSNPRSSSDPCLTLERKAALRPLPFLTGAALMARLHR